MSKRILALTKGSPLTTAQLPANAGDRVIVPRKPIHAVTKRTLVGKTIVGYESNPFPNGRGGSAHNPIIRLSDGTELLFETEETENLTYGTLVIRRESYK